MDGVNIYGFSRYICTCHLLKARNQILERRRETNKNKQQSVESGAQMKLNEKRLAC
jgi:hypothetical protein